MNTLCVLLLILFIYLCYLVYKEKTITNEKFQLYSVNNLSNQNFTLEGFQSNENPWFEDDDEKKYNSLGLNDKQKKEVKNMINQVTKKELKELINSQSPLLTGPVGPKGPPGPTGGNYIAVGRLANKLGSHRKGARLAIPEYVATRTEGTDNAQSLTFMSNIVPYASFQDWTLGSDNQLKSRYDQTCLTFDDKNNKLYMAECKNNPKQQWTWDNTSNRIISTNQENQSLKCIGLSKPEINKLTTNVPGCKDDACMNDIERRFLEIKDCDPNSVKEDEIWGFI